MSSEARVVKNIVWMALSMLLPNVINLGFLFISAKILHNAGYNGFDTAVGYISLFSLVSDFGMTGVFVRDASRNPANINRLFSSYFTLRSVMAVGFITLGLAIVTFIPVYSDPTIVSYIWLAALAQLIFQFGQIYSGLFQASERMTYTSIGTIVQAVAYFFLGLAFIGWANLGVPGLLYASILSYLLMFAVYAFFARTVNVSRARLGFDREIWKYFVLNSGWFALISIFNVLYGYIDRVMISFMNISQVADYTKPYTLVMSLSFISTAYMYVAFPVFSRLGIDNSSIKYTYEKSFKYLLLITLPICVGTMLLSDRIVYFFFDSSFAGAIPVLEVLVWLLLFAIVNTVGSPILSSSHRERVVMYNLILCTLANIALNIVLIPTMGAVGSAIASLLTVGILNALISWWYIRDDIRGIKLLRPMAGIVISSVVMGAAIYFLDLHNLLLDVVFGVIVYSVCVLLLGVISRDDLRLVKSVLAGVDREERPDKGATP